MRVRPKQARAEGNEPKDAESKVPDIVHAVYDATAFGLQIVGKQSVTTAYNVVDRASFPDAEQLRSQSDVDQSDILY